VRPGDAGIAHEIRRNVDVAEESTLVVLPLEARREPVEMLRSAFSRLLP